MILHVRLTPCDEATRTAYCKSVHVVKESTRWKSPQEVGTWSKADVNGLDPSLGKRGYFCPRFFYLSKNESFFIPAY